MDRVAVQANGAISPFASAALTICFCL